MHRVCLPQLEEIARRLLPFDAGHLISPYDLATLESLCFCDVCEASLHLLRDNERHAIRRLISLVCARRRRRPSNLLMAWRVMSPLASERPGRTERVAVVFAHPSSPASPAQSPLVPKLALQLPPQLLLADKVLLRFLWLHAPCCGQLPQSMPPPIVEWVAREPGTVP